MPREVMDEEGTKWTCAQAYAGLSDNGGDGQAARVESSDERYRVVCTPSGGAKTVRLELAADWEKSLGDKDLLREIESMRET